MGTTHNQGEYVGMVAERACAVVCLACGGEIIRGRGLSRCVRCGFVLCEGCEGGENFTLPDENQEA